MSTGRVVDLPIGGECSKLEVNGSDEDVGVVSWDGHADVPPKKSNESNAYDTQSTMG